MSYHNAPHSKPEEDRYRHGDHWNRDPNRARSHPTPAAEGVFRHAENSCFKADWRVDRPPLLQQSREFFIGH